MGSIGYLVGGALAGAGKGLETIGEQASKDRDVKEAHDWQDAHDQTMERLRAAHAEKMQSSGQEFQHGERLEQQDVAAHAAGAQREFLTGQEERKEAAAQKRTETTANSRIEARRIGATPKAPPKTWTPGHYQLQGTVSNGQLVPGATIPIMHNRDGRVFVQSGDKFMLYDSTKGTQLPDTKGVRNADPRAVQDLTNDPNGRVPDGSETKADAFYRAYHYLPGSYFSAAQREQDKGAAGGPLGKNAPPGSTFVPGQPFGGGGNAQDAQDDAEDYANTGDEGPQESDNTAAR